uniref:Uncharacterized protein n=1 Tax=Magnetococcus massalia (strain MO-1) TaxID=451514 RepID=A0A1S7LH97_MAGMO|nr:conserved protein of unknown function [Candidatus Magnetococcus massalia]
MAKRRFIWREGKMVEVDLHAPRPEPVGPMIMSDIEPYQNVVNRQWIGSRSSHRAFLKQHNLVEIGNEKVSSKAVETSSVRGDIQRAMQGR